MALRLVFDSALAVSAETFVAEWQRQPDTVAFGTARAATLASEVGQSPARFGDAETMAALVAILMGVPSNALWDAIKFTCHKLLSTGGPSAATPQREIEFQHVKFPDGTEVTIVKYKE